MRLAFIVMALLNIAFFAWQYPRDGDWEVPAVEHKAAKKEGKESIILLHELQSSNDEGNDSGLKTVSLTRPSPVAPVDKPVSVRKQRLNEILSSRVCFSVGPFHSRNAREAVATRLKGAGAETQMRIMENRENVRYWVTYVAENSYTARETYKDLQSKGLRDISLMPGESSENIVSLGLFRGENTANRRMEEIRGLGYAPTVKKQYSSRTSFWIDAEQDPKQALTDAVWRKILDFSESAQYRVVPCK